MSDETDQLPHILCEALLSRARFNEPDLTLRQFAVLLLVYHTAEPQTVSGLARYLELTGSTVTRVLNRLEDLKLACREINRLDSRSMVVERTTGGTVMMQRLKGAMTEASDRAVGLQSSRSTTE